MPLNVELLDDLQIDKLIPIALHCILNGPVGVNKETEFPVVGLGSIRAHLGVSISNSQWRATVLPIAEYIMRSPEWKEVIEKSQHAHLYGSVWPVAEKPL